jgi:hypothetical protein
MLQIRVLSGTKAGTICVARRFPFGIGRASSMDLCLEDDGVWDRHLVLDLTSESRITVTVQSEATATANGDCFHQVGMRNGDILAIGSVQLQLWLSETRPISFRHREWLMWIFLAALSLGQLALVYWLRR